MIRIYLELLAEAVAVALCIGIVIAFCAVGCAMNKRDASQGIIAKGFPAPIASRLQAH